MTLAQLQSFVLVARLGSVKAAAAELGVTEPAVSVAVAALRRELGDELFVRDGRGIAVTPGGRRLAALAGEILGLAEQARRSVQDSPGQARLMQVAVTSMVAEHIGPLIDAFTARDASVEVAIESARGDALAEMLEHRRADIALGPAPAPELAATIASVPFLRSRLIVVAAPGHGLAGRRDIPAAELARERWLLGPPERDPTTGAGRRGRRDRPDAGAHGHRGAAPPRPDPARRPRHSDPGNVACQHARLRPGAARGPGVPAFRHQPRGDAGDLDRARRHGVVPRAGSPARHAVELGGRRPANRRGDVTLRTCES
jgi:DNA-binding transcriptional LysR family regulator